MKLGKKFVKSPILMAFFLVSTLNACSNETDYIGFEQSISRNTPDKFFLFFNQQSELSAGFYQIVIAPNAANSTTSFILTIEKNNGEAKQIIKSNWGNSVGSSLSPWTTCTGDPQNYCVDLTLTDATGVTISLESAEDNIIYLVNKHNSPTLIRTQDATGIGEKEVIAYKPTQVRETKYAQAYNAAVDVNNNRDTFQKFKTLHGFDGSDEVHVTFKDNKDLGYGRDMYMRSYSSPDCGGQQVTVFYVRNFKVDVIDGFSYGELNLDAAIDSNLTFHFGSNAIEFSKGFDSKGETCADEPYNRFFTYQSDYSSPNADHKRINQVDLDGRGEKAMPQPCISCHGGKARPLDRFGRFVTINVNDSANQIGDTKSRLQAFEVNTFSYSDKSGFKRSDLEERLRILNSAVYCTYAGSAGHAACASFGGGQPAQTDDGEWNGNFARDVLNGAYNQKIEVVNTSYTKDYVPVGWQPSVANNIPEGADTLFTSVINPNCFVCHGKRGSSLGSERNANLEGKDIDFSSWSKFISHAEEIRRLVYEEGRMPLGLLNYDDFWNDLSRPELLASFIAPNVVDFSKHLDADNNLILPGNPVAHAGLDRVTKTNAAITLNASSSLFADQYQWRVKNAVTGSQVILSDKTQPLLSFTTDIVGSYELELTITNINMNKTDVDSVVILVDDALLKNPQDLTFYNDITAELDNCATQCHSTPTTATEVFDGIPVWWTSDATQPITPPNNQTETPALGLYEQARTRINLNDLENSLILKKPSNTHHFGGLRPGFDTTANVGSPLRSVYDLFVNWISEGAVCGGTSTQCPNENN